MSLRQAVRLSGRSLPEARPQQRFARCLYASCTWGLARLPAQERPLPQICLRVPRPGLVRTGRRAWSMRDLEDPRSRVGLPGSALLAHLEGCSGLRSCLSFTWLSSPGSRHGLTEATLSSLGLGRALSSLKPRPRSAIVRAVYHSLARKDARLLVGALAVLLESVHFKSHRGLLFQLSKFFLSSAGYFEASLGVRGLRIRISGKIGVGGNSKKRVSSIDTQGCSYASKRSRFSLFQGQARTTVGALGILVVIAS